MLKIKIIAVGKTKKAPVNLHLEKTGAYKHSGVIQLRQVLHRTRVLCLSRILSPYTQTCQVSDGYIILIITAAAHIRKPEPIAIYPSVQIRFTVISLHLFFSFVTARIPIALSAAHRPIPKNTRNKIAMSISNQKKLQVSQRHMY